MGKIPAFSRQDSQKVVVRRAPDRQWPVRALSRRLFMREVDAIGEAEVYGGRARRSSRDTPTRSPETEHGVR
jgi:hypothetical protein